LLESQRDPMKIQKSILVLITILAGILPTLIMLVNINTNNLPIWILVSLVLFYSVTAIVRKRYRQDTDLQRAEINFICAIYAGSAIIFYIIGLVVMG